MGPAAIRKANQASTSQLSADVSAAEVIKDSHYRFTVSNSEELTTEDRKVIWDIFESNMRDMYVKSAFGWDPSSKQEELFDKMSRFILCRMSDDSEGGPLVAYTIFRFDREEGEDVAYCYELQVAESSRKRGLGKALMQKLCSIGSKWRMKKAMLTVLKENTAAVKFYTSTGFAVDPTSPEYQSDEDEDWDDEDQDEEYDYVILSKTL
ncbi:acyl-CoA N-acyltransferase [Athelia psychrophila]|uniref:N-alpha-acetyltransferase 40 n=1 Tax=Athelia psychrophila TaxID=1759441 RepID=A0A166U459_9AGAM|nr:acyl-CoA N-acyltransferase [Fibularhizoctonia sp. CBS 109695]